MVHEWDLPTKGRYLNGSYTWKYKFQLKTTKTRCPGNGTLLVDPWFPTSGLCARCPLSNWTCFIMNKFNLRRRWGQYREGWAGPGFCTVGNQSEWLTGGQLVGVKIHITVCMTKYEKIRMQTYITKRTGGQSAKKRTRHRGIQYSTWQTQHQRLKKCSL